MDRVLLALIRLYQQGISPHTPPSCRYHPTCSEYARLCITRHGWRTGTWLTVLRILRCHPFHPGGADPAPHSDANP
ncbi:MAG: membrane protein insertion efficiency factor YidD [Deltaproteobacteria bacterium]|nr:MAG: membrane protein insertion efficiency factor YidD [Deltaproteobacteria bacterium]